MPPFMTSVLEELMQQKAKERAEAGEKADEGATMKRWRPRAQGRATRINKRTSHITVVVTPTRTATKGR